MDVSVTNLGDDGYEVKIGEKRITLPKESKASDEPNAYTMYGTADKYIRVDVGSNAMYLIENGNEDEIVPDDDEHYDEREAIAGELSEKWSKAITKVKGGSRLNRKAKRTKRNRRNLKRSKLRKLTTRRR
jgi:transposase